MEHAEANREVIRLDDYRLYHHEDERGQHQLLADLAALANCILTAAEILARISPPQ